LDKKERKKVFSMNPTFSHLAAPRCTQFANIAPPPMGCTETGSPISASPLPRFLTQVSASPLFF
jgi:hypothetical protein